MFEFIAGLFLFGTFWFWVLAIMFFALIESFVDFWERGALALILTVSFGIIFAWSNHVDVGGWLAVNFWNVVVGILIYLIVGGVYIPLRWKMEVNDWRSDIFERDATEAYRNEKFESQRDLDPMRRIDDLTRWGTFWIFDLPWQILREGIVRIYRAYVFSLKNILLSISRKVYEDVQTEANRKTTKR